jgi:hypothetical protein
VKQPASLVGALNSPHDKSADLGPQGRRAGFSTLWLQVPLPRPCELRLPTSGPVRQNEVCTTLRWREMDSNSRSPPTDLRLSRKSARLLARDRGVGADVSVQPGFVIIMPAPLEASGAPLCCSPVDPEDDERDQVPTIRAICRTEGCKYLEWTRAPRSR